MDPTDLIWYKPFPRGMLLNLAFSFTFWTFNTLYGVDIWSALVSQNFETKVESWRQANYTYLLKSYVSILCVSIYMYSA